MTSESKVAARALLAHNPVTFECIRGMSESIALLASATIDTSGQPSLLSPGDGLRGAVTAESVTVAFGPPGSKAISQTHFHGRWESDLNGARLVGETRPGLHARMAMTLLSIALAATLGGGFAMAFIAGWTDPLTLGCLIAGGIGVLLLPVVVSGLGSSRIAREIEIVRAIGLAIGDPEKYAKPKWRRWKDD